MGMVISESPVINEEITTQFKRVLMGASQFNGLTPSKVSRMARQAISLDHGKAVGIYQSHAFSVNLQAEMVYLSTSRITEFFIKGDVDDFFWLGYSNYVVHPKENMILNIRTGRPVTVNDGKVQLTSDGGKRNCYTIQYIYETLRNHLKGVTH